MPACLPPSQPPRSIHKLTRLAHRHPARLPYRDAMATRSILLLLLGLLVAVLAQEAPVAPSPRVVLRGSVAAVAVAGRAWLDFSDEADRRERTAMK